MFHCGFDLHFPNGWWCWVSFPMLIDHVSIRRYMCVVYSWRNFYSHLFTHFSLGYLSFRCLITESFFFFNHLGWHWCRYLDGIKTIEWAVGILKHEMHELVLYSASLCCKQVEQFGLMLIYWNYLLNTFILSWLTLILPYSSFCALLLGLSALWASSLRSPLILSYLLS